MSKFLFVFFYSTISCLVFGAPLSKSEAWIDSISSPEIMGHYFEKNFPSLPLIGTVTPSDKYWSGDYWATRNGSINYRWYSENKVGFNLVSPTKESASRMSITELAKLSPAEKYDLFLGRYDYPLKNEVAKNSDRRAQFWEGICHGWSPASMNHNEPTPKFLENPDGISIPFGSTDIKGLLSYYYAYIHRAPDTQQMGRRCFSNNRRVEKECHNDLNAGAFHIVIANRLGILETGVIADLKRFDEVWNHPIIGYDSKVVKEYGPGRNSAAGTNKVIQVRTAISYVDENGNDWHPVLRTRKQSHKSIIYEYELELDHQDHIIGGEWISSNRPDFIWIMRQPRKFEGILSKLRELLND